MKGLRLFRRWVRGMLQHRGEQLEWTSDEDGGTLIMTPNTDLMTPGTSEDENWDETREELPQTPQRVERWNSQPSINKELVSSNNRGITPWSMEDDIALRGKWHPLGQFMNASKVTIHTGHGLYELGNAYRGSLARREESR